MDGDETANMLPAPMDDGAPIAGSVTRLLRQWGAGEDAALQRLVESAYEELGKIAGKHLHRERAGHSLAPAELVHEAYVRLLDARDVGWKDRGHFYAVASRIMRRVLIDHARHRGAARRRGVTVELREQDAVTGGLDVDVLALDEALTKLEARHERACRVVELRYFGGLTLEEAALQLSVSLATAKLDWKFARTWLWRELERGRPPAR